MRSILFLAYYYSPVNNAGTQRIEKFVKFLPQFGFKPLILTTSYFSRPFFSVKSFRLARRISEERKEKVKVYPVRDPMCGHIGRRPGRLISNGVYRAGELRNIIVRKRGKEFKEISGYTEPKTNPGLAKLKNFLKRWVLIPDSKITWLPFAFCKALWIIKKHRAEYLFSSFPPATSHLLGYFLKKCTYVKWIADFRDGWCLDPLAQTLALSPTRLALEKILERLVVKNCDQILVTSQDVGRYLGGGEKVSLLTNGFDKDDFTLAYKTLNKLKNLENYFVISHPGAFHFSHPGNTPYYFLQALKEVFSEHPEMKKRTRVFFLGNLTGEEKEMPPKMGLEGQVEVLGLKSPQEAISYRLISSLLLLVDRPRVNRSTYIHGKIFEHLASRKPILALLPQDSASRDFLEKLGVGEIVEPQDIERIKKKLWELFSEWQSGGILRYELTDQELAQFETKNLTKKLAEILKDIRVN